jgi:hypothetical protein
MLHVIAPCQSSGGGGGSGLVLTELLDPTEGSVADGTVFIRKTTTAAGLPANTLMAFYGGFPAYYGYGTDSTYSYSLAVKTSGGIKTIQGLT